MAWSPSPDMSRRDTLRFGNASPSPTKFSSWNITWNSGLRLSCRSGRNSSTSFSKGRS